MEQPWGPQNSAVLFCFAEGGSILKFIAGWLCNVQEKYSLSVRM
jgi:hypothetical protein